MRTLRPTGALLRFQGVSVERMTGTEPALSPWDGDERHVLAGVGEQRFAVRLREAQVSPCGVHHGCPGGADADD